MMTPEEFWLTAAQWGSFVRNGDPGACLYGFNEHGTVRSEEHRAQCIAYIETLCRDAADFNIAAGDDPATQHPELDALVAYLRQAPVAK